MTGRVSYGELMGQAARRIAEASGLLATQPLPDRAKALGAIAAYFRLLAAVRCHGWQLLGGDDRRLGAASRVTRDGRDAAAVRLLDTLAGVRPAPGTDPGGAAPGPLAGAWSEAARCVGAAGDLLATHRDTDGAHRSATAWLLDDAEVRAAGLGALAHATEPVAGDATGLGLRALQAGVEPSRARTLARLPATVGPAARELRTLCAPAVSARDALAGLELARPAVRTDHPIDELGDRLARLHRGAWQLVREPYVGVTTLTDYAALGVIVHAHAAALLSSVPAHRIDGDTPDPMLSRVQRGRRAWRRLHRQLDELRTATPGSPGVRSDLLRVRHLLRSHVPLPPDGGAALVTADRRLITVTLGALGALDAMVGWNVQVFNTLAATGQLYVDGRRITGDEVARNEEVVAAKLHGGLAPLPGSRLVAIRDAYKGVADAYPATPSHFDTPMAQPTSAPLPPGTDWPAPST